MMFDNMLLFVIIYNDGVPHGTGIRVLLYHQIMCSLIDENAARTPKLNRYTALQHYLFKHLHKGPVQDVQ